MDIAERFHRIRQRIPEHVILVLACKTRTPDEVRDVIAAGARDLGHNYVQEAELMVDALGEAALKARWHMIGPLQKNKINKALRIFDVCQTIHDADQADAIEKRAAASGKTLSALIEINSADEPNKSGVPPRVAEVETLARHIAALPHLCLEGLMTMGPFLDDPNEIRPYFRKTRDLFSHLKSLDLPGTDLTTLSMGMSDSFEAAIAEGSTMVRIGTIVFGPRR